MRRPRPRADLGTILVLLPCLGTPMAAGPPSRRASMAVADALTGRSLEELMDLENIPLPDDLLVPMDGRRLESPVLPGGVFRDPGGTLLRPAGQVSPGSAVPHR